MKKRIIICILLLTVTLTGCTINREKLTYKGTEGTISFNVKKSLNYKISTKKKDLKIPTEQAVLIGKDFKIGIEFDDSFPYFYNSDFKELMKKRKHKEDYKKVSYSNIEGIEYFNSSYNSYNVLLPCGNSKKYYLMLSIYGKDDTKETVKETIKKKEIIDILNHIIEIKTKS